MLYMDAFTQCMKDFKKTLVISRDITPNINLEKYNELWRIELYGIVKCKPQFHQVDYSTISTKDKEKYFSETEYPNSNSVSNDILNNESKWNNMKDVLGSNNKRPLWGKGYYFSGFFPKHEFQINNGGYELGYNTGIYNTFTNLQNNYTGKSYDIGYTFEW